MSIKSSNVLVSQVRSCDRFEPRFHIMYSSFANYRRQSRYEVVELGDPRVLKRVTDGEHAGQDFVDSGIRFVKNSAVKDFGINLLDNFFITPEKHSRQSRSALKPLDILFTTIGHLGATAIISEDFGEANINQNVVKLEINKDFINPYYLAAYLNSSVTKIQIASLFTGNIHSILTYPKIKSIRVLIPDKTFQLNIESLYVRALKAERDFFLKIDEAQNSYRKILGVDLRDIAKPLSFNVDSRSLSESDIWNPAFFSPRYLEVLKAIEMKFDLIPLGKIADIRSGDEIGSNSYIKYLEKKSSDVPFIRTSDLFNFEMDQFPDFYAPIETYDELDQELLDKDIVFTKDGKIGSVAMVTEFDRAIVASGLEIIRLKHVEKAKTLTPEFLFLVLMSAETGKAPALRRSVHASTIPHLREDRLREFEVPMLGVKDVEYLTELVRQAFEFKNTKKRLIDEVRRSIDGLL